MPQQAPGTARLFDLSMWQSKYATLGQILWLVSTCHCRKLNPASKRSRIGRCSWLMRDVCSLIWLALIGLFRSRASLQAEILTLRHQLNVLRRKSPQRLTFTSVDRLVFAGLYRLAPGVLDALKIVRPETVIRWHRAGFRTYWRWTSRPRATDYRCGGSHRHHRQRSHGIRCGTSSCPAQ